MTSRIVRRGIVPDLSSKTVLFSGEPSGPVTQPLLNLPLTHTLVPTFSGGDGTPSFIRGSIANVPDYQGVLQEVAAGVPRFWGARLDVDGVTWHATKANGTSPISEAVLKGYVSENAATNEYERSEEFTSGSWQKVRSTISTGFTGPDGNSTASKLIATVDDNSHLVRQTIFPAPLENELYTVSFFIKAAEYDYARIQFPAYGNAFPRIDINLIDGTIVESFVEDSAALQLADGWWRFSMTVDMGTGTPPANGPNISPAITLGDNVFPGNGSDGILLWGAQVEQGNQLTSYIRSESTKGTRAADSLTYPAAGNINAAEGTVQAEIQSFFRSTPTALSVIQRDSGTAIIGSTNATLAFASMGSGFASASGASMFLNSTPVKTQYGSELKITFAGITSAQSTYNGNIGTGAIGIGCDNTLDNQFRGSIKNVLIYNLEEVP